MRTCQCLSADTSSTTCACGHGNKKETSVAQRLLPGCAARTSACLRKCSLYRVCNRIGNRYRPEAPSHLHPRSVTRRVAASCISVEQRTARWHLPPAQYSHHGRCGRCQHRLCLSLRAQLRPAQAHTSRCGCRVVGVGFTPVAHTGVHETMCGASTAVESVAGPRGLLAAHGVDSSCCRWSRPPHRTRAAAAVGTDRRHAAACTHQ